MFGSALSRARWAVSAVNRRKQPGSFPHPSTWIVTGECDDGQSRIERCERSACFVFPTKRIDRQSGQINIDIGGFFQWESRQNLKVDILGPVTTSVQCYSWLLLSF